MIYITRILLLNIVHKYAKLNDPNCKETIFTEKNQTEFEQRPFKITVKMLTCESNIGQTCDANTNCNENAFCVRNKG